MSEQRPVPGWYLKEGITYGLLQDAKEPRLSKWPPLTSPRYEKSSPWRLPHWPVAHTSRRQIFWDRKFFWLDPLQGEGCVVLESSKCFCLLPPWRLQLHPAAVGAPGRRHLISYQASFELAPNAAHPLVTLACNSFRISSQASHGPNFCCLGNRVNRLLVSVII